MPVRAPPLLDLARQTTLANSSLSELSLPPRPSDPESDDLEYNPIKSSTPTLIRQNTPSRTSIDSLRTIQSRSLHTSAPSETRPSFAPGWWFQHKQDVEPLLDDKDKDDAVETSEDKLRKRYLAPKEACVLAHGLLGFDSVSVATIGISYWRGIKEALEAIGCEVLIARVPATSSIQERATVLESIISRELPGRKVHLIGHSMGGLDSRYLVSKLRSDRFTPVSVTCIASPHRGSSFATTFLEMLGQERLPQFLQFLDLLPNGGGDGKAFESLTPEAMAQFNEETPDAPDVDYFSFGASYNPGLIDTFKWPHSVILEAEGPNDGLVSVKSSKWGKYVGTIENVNHLDLVGWVNHARFAWADLTGKSIKFRPATFYLEIVDMLAQKVEGQKKHTTTNGHSEAIQDSSQVDTNANVDTPPAPPTPTVPEPARQA
ncbi:alpha/beta-hydrolase [Clavulina sp. PMI_390]|nr:alpha/beta-hydrolase [Clavulina sp. PMI_390]